MIIFKSQSPISFSYLNHILNFFWQQQIPFQLQLLVMNSARQQVAVQGLLKSTGEAEKQFWAQTPALAQLQLWAALYRSTRS